MSQSVRPAVLHLHMHPDWLTALAEYETSQRAAGRSEGTVRVHRHYLIRLAREVPRPYSATLRQLETFVGHRSWMPETRKSARSAVRGFYRWAHGRGYMEDDPAISLPAITVPTAVARPTPEHLVRQLTAHDDRVGTMAMLAAYCGLRRAEIARVHRRDLVGEELLIRGKGGKVRAVPVTSFELLSRLGSATDWLFPNGQGDHLTPGHVGRLLSAAMPEGWTAHTLRHRMASVSYAGTRDLLAVGAVLGHSRPETTQRYVRLPSDAIRAAVIAASAA